MTFCWENLISIFMCLAVCLHSLFIHRSRHQADLQFPQTNENHSYPCLVSILLVPLVIPVFLSHGSHKVPKARRIPSQPHMLLGTGPRQWLPVFRVSRGMAMGLHQDLLKSNSHWVADWTLLYRSERKQQEFIVVGPHKAL